MKLYHTGNLRKVINGQIDLKNLTTFNPERFAYGLGTMIRDGLVLESILINHQAVGYYPGKEYLCKDAFEVAFYAGSSQKPKNKIKVLSPTSIEEFYYKIYLELKVPFVVMGTGIFETIDLRYLKKNPTSDQNILKHKNQYIEIEKLNEKEGSFFGFVLDHLDESFLYEPPFKNQVYSHTHLCSGNKAGHLMAQSILKSGFIYFEKIESFLQID